MPTSTFVKGMNSHLNLNTRFFHSMTLAANGGRIVVRRWLDTPLPRAVNALKQWFTDLEIEAIQVPRKSQKRRPLSQTRPRTRNPARRIPRGFLRPTAVFHVRPRLHHRPRPLRGPHLRLRRPLPRRPGGEQPPGPARPRAPPPPHRRHPVRQRHPVPHLPICPHQADPDPFQGVPHGSPLRRRRNPRRRLQLRSASRRPRRHAVRRPGPRRSRCRRPVLRQRLHLPPQRLPAPPSAGEAPPRQALKSSNPSLRAAGFALGSRLDAICLLFPSKEPGASPEFPGLLTPQEQGRFALGFHQQKALDELRRRKAAEAKKAAGSKLRSTPISPETTPSPRPSSLPKESD